MKRILRYVVAFLLTALVVIPAQASHFRFGQITWKRLPGAPNPRTVEFTIKEAWRTATLPSASSDLVYFSGQAGNLTPVVSTIGTFIDLAGESYTVIQKVATYTYTSDGPFNVSAGNCCRISSLINAADASEQLQAVVDLRNGNQGSPVGSVPIILQMTQGIVNNVLLAIPDPDGDPVTCRMATSGESGIPAVATAGGFPLTVSSNGVLSWNTIGTVIGQKYAVQVIAQENHAGNVARVPLDFIIEITGSVNQPPTCSGTSGTTVVPVGTPFTATITGIDPDGTTLRVNHLGLPPGATMSPTNGSTGASPLTATINWTPGPSDAGSAYSVTLLFTDAGGLVANSCTFGITVPLNRPPAAVCQDVTVAANGSCVASASIDGGSSDPDGDAITIVQTPPGPYPLGTNVVTLTVTDSKGASNSCTAFVTVIDTTPPDINCPTNNIVVANDPGQCSAVVNYTVTATDNCDLLSSKLYGNSFAGGIFEVNTGTGAATSLSSSGTDSLVGIAFQPGTGELFGLTTFLGTPANALLKIDPITGATTTVGATGLSSILEGDLAFNPVNGQLYGIQNSAGGVRSIFQLDPLTGVATVLGTYSNSIDYSAIAFDSAGTLFAIDTLTSGSGNAILYTLDPSNGAALTSVTMNVDLGAVAGMAFDPATGVCYVADGLPGGTSTLYTLNTTTGVLTPVGATGNAGGLAGLAFNLTSNATPGITFVCNPPSGSAFPKGTTTVTCTATDAAGNTATCTFTVTVNDTEPPLVACREGANPSGKKIPVAGKQPKSGQNPDGFYQLLTADNCDPNPAIYIVDPVSGFLAGPFANGDIVKITQVPGGTPRQQPMAGVVVAHVFVNGDAVLYAADADGNIGNGTSCLVPPAPK